MPSRGRVHSIQISDGGVPKRAIASAEITAAGVAGDRQRFLRYHGGPNRAVSLFSLEVIERLRAEGHPIAPGTAGENLTIAGLDWSALAPGVRLKIGDAVVLELTKPASPCKTIAASFLGGASDRISADKHPGESRWYARVVRDGRVAVGCDVVVARDQFATDG